MSPVDCRIVETEPSVQLDLETGTLCRRTSDSRTCMFQTGIEDIFWGGGTIVQLRSYLFTYLITYLDFREVLQRY